MKQALDTYRSLLNLHGATFSKIDHEDAMVAVVYKITQTNGEQLILKICDRVNDYLREVHFLNHFAGSLPVPIIRQAVPPKSDLHGAILMECLPGSLLKAIDLTEGLAYEIGSCLAQIHLNRIYKGKLKGIIDWAGARASFAEEDLCSLEHGQWSTSQPSKKSLLAGYASVRQVPNYIRLTPFLRVNKAIATIGFTVKRKTWKGRDSRIYQYNHQFLENFFEENL